MRPIKCFPIRRRSRVTITLVLLITKAVIRMARILIILIFLEGWADNRGWKIFLICSRGCSAEDFAGLMKEKKVQGERIYIWKLILKKATWELRKLLNSRQWTYATNAAEKG